MAEQKNSTNLADILPEEFVNERKERSEKFDVDSGDYWDFLGDLGYHLGFDAVRAVLDDVITLDQAKKLLDGAKRSYNAYIYDIAVANIAAVVPSNFNSILSNYIRGMK